MARDMVRNLFSFLSGISFVVGVIANSVMMGYFLSRDRGIPNLLYTSIATNHLVLSALVLPFGVALFFESPKWYDIHTVCDAWGMAWDISNQMSVYLFMVFSIVRTKRLLFPFGGRSKGLVQSAIVGYLIFLLLQAVTPYFFDAHYSYDEEMHICRWEYRKLFALDSKQYLRVFVVENLLERLLPMLVVVMCCIISWCVLTGRRLESNDRRENEGAASLAVIQVKWWEWVVCKQRAINVRRARDKWELQEQIKLRASMTVLLTTLNFTILNLPNIVYMLLRTLDIMEHNHTPSPSYLQFDDKKYFTIFACVVGSMIHAVNTPFVCLWRMSDFQLFLLNKALVIREASLAFFNRRADPTRVEDNNMENGCCPLSCKSRAEEEPAIILNPLYGKSNGNYLAR